MERRLLDDDDLDAMSLSEVLFEIASECGLPQDEATILKYLDSLSLAELGALIARMTKDSDLTIN